MRYLLLFLLMLAGCAEQIPVSYDPDFVFLTDSADLDETRAMDISAVFVETDLSVTQVIGLKEDGKLVIRVMPIAESYTPYWTANWTSALQKSVSEQFDYGYDGIAFRGVEVHEEFAFISSVKSDDAMVDLITNTSDFIKERDSQYRVMLITDDSLAKDLEVDALVVSHISKDNDAADKELYVNTSCEIFQICKELGHHCATQGCED